jgi:starch-binding outer membrane protein, SusD/RagB family
VKIYREPVDDVVKYITDLMLEAASDLPSPSEVVEGTEAGRIDKLIALSMRGKVLLFAASPLFNGNSDYAHMVDGRGVQLFSQEYNQEKWILASNALKDAIDYAHAEGKNLYDLVDPLVVGAPEPLQVQTTFREAITGRWNKELIWGGTNYDCNFLANHSEARIINRAIEYVRYTRSDWSPTMKMVEKFYSSNGVPINEDLQWQSRGWYNNRFEVRPEPSAGDEKFFIKEDEKTVYLHFNREPRFYATVGFDKGIYFGGGYYNFPENVKYTNFFQGGHSGRTGVANFAITGYSAKKMHSFKNAQTTNAHSIEYFPFPILRLSDLYLMYAEAFNEANGPSDEVYFYLDLIRARVGLAGIKHAWSNHSILPNKPDTKEGLREIIHQERTIELMLEGKRYWDIRRWKKINELNIPPKGWNSEGENHDDFYNVIVVARDPLNFGVKDYFAPIKENNLIINPNLIQNFGW